MTQFTFINSRGNEVVVIADSEQDARRAAMVKVWGKYPHYYGTVRQAEGPYNGEGLLLKSTTEAEMGR